MDGFSTMIFHQKPSPCPSSHSADVHYSMKLPEKGETITKASNKISVKSRGKQCRSFVCDWGG